MGIEIRNKGKYNYVDSEGSSKNVILLLHGLFGELSNFETIFNYFKKDYRIVIPILPLVDIPLRQIGLTYIVDFVKEFIDELKLDNINLLGNSLGGHIAQLYTLEYPTRVKSLILTGSSGLFENSFGGTFLRRNDYNYIKEKVEMTFYDANTATKEMVDRVFGEVNNRNKAIRLVGIAKSAIKHNLEDRISNIKIPTLLIWGINDTITPPFVAEKFRDLINNSELCLIDKCGHAPMMEEPDKFNLHLEEFLKKCNKEELALKQT